MCALNLMCFKVKYSCFQSVVNGAFSIEIFFLFGTRLERETGKKLIEIIDVGKENIDQDRKEESSHDSDEILCNSMKMMREKLTISEGIS